VAVLAEVGGPRIVVLNKSDLGTDAGWASNGALLRPGDTVVVCSLVSGEGLDDLRGAIRHAFGSDAHDVRREAPLVTNIRHEGLLREARASLIRALAGLRARGDAASEELVLADIGVARRAFEEVCGRRTADDVLTAIFDRFCIGK
jgi:tRNA modification GTPase